LSQEGLSRLRDETHMRWKKETKAKVKKRKGNKKTKQKKGWGNKKN
jgi:hypothetical protein